MSCQHCHVSFERQVSLQSQSSVQIEEAPVVQPKSFLYHRLTHIRGAKTARTQSTTSAIKLSGMQPQVDAYDAVEVCEASVRLDSSPPPAVFSSPPRWHHAAITLRASRSTKSYGQETRLTWSHHDSLLALIVGGRQQKPRTRVSWRRRRIVIALLNARAASARTPAPHV
jgi:hypothetical protein